MERKGLYTQILLENSPFARLREINIYIYIFICYVYGQNAILVRPIKTCETSSLLQAFMSVYEYLKGKHLKPKLHVMDNETSTIIEN